MESIDAFLRALDEQIADKHLLKHPFYQAWSQGKLNKECLKEYALEYYHHVRAFPTYLSALHAHTPDMKTRKELLKNLIEEEAGTPNHPELWKTFTLSLGATEEEVEQHTPCAAIETLIQTFRSICRDGGPAQGIAALYAYESQIPAICISKIDGLKTYYGMSSALDWQYFSIHIAADEEHSKVERQLLSRHVILSDAQHIHNATCRVLDALWNFLTHMCHRYEIAC